MPESLDRDYYRARAARLLMMAENAIDPDIAAIHRQMANSYIELESLTPPEKSTIAAAVNRTRS